ncbi:MAG: cell division protein FtsX [Alphaproteobacteria bacterium]|jgi:cell division transport system permease protein|nr:cell division protein FtsX [Alphaproteobacteria bacterium]
MSRPAPLLPEGDAREAALFFVVCALCFLAALAALSARASYSAARGWTAEVEGQMTIRLQGEDRRGAAEALDIVQATEGVESARILSRDEVESLLEPSFGAGGLPAGLPMPLILDVYADPEYRDMDETLENRLADSGIGALVDTHSDWAGDVRRALGVVRLVALSTVLLLGATAVAVIAFATHAALLARRDIVEVLHLSGATDRFISRLFERRFWLLGLQAGGVGALFALGTTALVLSLASARGGRSGLLPQLSLDALDFLILVTTPIIAAIAARLAARMTVLRSLKGSL